MGIAMAVLGELSLIAGIIAFLLRDGLRAELRRNPGILFGSLDGAARLEAELNSYQTYGVVGVGIAIVLLVGAVVFVAIRGAPTRADGAQTASGARSRIVAGVLQACFAPLGIGRHYLGFHGIAIAQLIVCWFTVGIGVLWPLVDALLILSGRVRDGRGHELRE